MNSMALFLAKKNIITEAYHPGQAGVIFFAFLGKCKYVRGEIKSTRERRAQNRETFLI